jgi:hypothetical protein
MGGEELFREHVEGAQAGRVRQAVTENLEGAKIRRVGRVQRGRYAVDHVRRRTVSALYGLVLDVVDDETARMQQLHDLTDARRHRRQPAAHQERELGDARSPAFPAAIGEVPERRVHPLREHVAHKLVGFLAEHRPDLPQVESSRPDGREGVTVVTGTVGGASFPCTRLVGATVDEVHGRSERKRRHVRSRVLAVHVLLRMTAWCGFGAGGVASRNRRR